MKLVIQSEDSLLAAGLSSACERAGHETLRVATLGDLERAIEEAELDLAVVDLCAGQSLAALRALSDLMPALRVLALTSDASAHAVVDGLRAGAAEVLVKPFGVGELEPALRRAAGPLRPALDWIAAAPASRALLQTAQRAAVTGASLLIRGELGVGKTHLARLIHDLSPRRAGPRVEVNLNELDTMDAIAALLGCVAPDGSRRPGWIEAADGGTLIIEGIEALHRNSTGRSPGDGGAVEDLLLDFIDRREVRPIGAAGSLGVDVRIVATLRCRSTRSQGAANPDANAHGNKRREALGATALETRLGVVSLDLVPLALRREDIVPLATHFIARFASAGHDAWPQLDAPMLDALAQRDFAGNVTELRNLIERAVLLFPGAQIDLAGLTGDALPGTSGRTGQPARSHRARRPPRSGSADTLDALNLREMERAAVIRSLELSRGNRSVAARALGVSTRTLRNKIQSYGLR